jgi:hypothetical protein
MDGQFSCLPLCDSAQHSASAASGHRPSICEQSADPESALGHWLAFLHITGLNNTSC